MNVQDVQVLDYYAREIRGVEQPEPLAGLRLSAFRAARGRLVASGRLIRTKTGRYMPVSS